ncbi:MAG: tyrosine-type recombinase/integrase [Chloroflexota bacterium]
MFHRATGLLAVIRDAARLALLYGSGLRRAEAAGLDIEDLDRENGAITVRAGKGRKDRICYSATGQRQLMDIWLRLRAEEGTVGGADLPSYY